MTERDSVKQLVREIRASRLPPPDERRSIREQAHVSLRDVARVLGVDPMTVLRWERGLEPRRANAVAYRQLLDALEKAVL